LTWLLAQRKGQRRRRLAPPSATTCQSWPSPLDCGGLRHGAKGRPRAAHPGSVKWGTLMFFSSGEVRFSRLARGPSRAANRPPLLCRPPRATARRTTLVIFGPRRGARRGHAQGDERRGAQEARLFTCANNRSFIGDPSARTSTRTRPLFGIEQQFPRGRGLLLRVWAPRGPRAKKLARASGVRPRVRGHGGHHGGDPGRSRQRAGRRLPQLACSCSAWGDLPRASPKGRTDVTVVELEAAYVGWVHGPTRAATCGT